MTDRELMQQALDALEGLTDIEWTAAFKQCKYDSDEPKENVERERVLGTITALRERLAQPQQACEINADTDAIGMAIQDAFVCGTGVVKLCLDAGKMTFDHVPIKDFNVFGGELKWRAAHLYKENKQ